MPLRLPGLGPESPVGRLVTRATGGRLSPRGLRLASFGAALALGLGLVAMVFAVQVSSTPNFCGSCHIMKPYYESWKTSGHRDIACVECHISPGITAEVRKKFEALSMVAKYFTGTYSTNPWAEVDDAACLRCHERRLLDGKELFHEVMFDHTPHLTESRRGLKLRCTSCHSQIVQGSHISVTPSTCALCHFKGQQTNEGTGACLTCHEIPDQVLTSTGVTFDHGQVKRLDMNCTLCHGGAVRGEGNVPRERCLTCHNQTERLEKIGDKDFLHRMHVTEHKVDCMNCHLQIEHGRLPAPGATGAAGAEVAHGAGLGATGGATIGAPGGTSHGAGATPGADCRSCHGSGHSPQQDLYAGIGGRGVPRMPSPMFSAGVTCEGCHNSALSGEMPRGVSAHAASTDLEGIRTVRASAVSCMSCHGPGYKKIFDQWQDGLAARSGALRAQLDATAPSMGVAPPAAWEDARHNYLLVERGRGVHNVNFAFALLARSHDQMNEARKARGQAPLARPWAVAGAGSERCLQCHLGIEAQSGTFAGRTFSHRPHTEAAKLECGECHRPHEQRAPGEVVKFAASGCVPCHHRKAEAAEPACRTCHTDVRTGTVPSFRGEFSHAVHLEQGLECATCHSGASGDPRPPKSACADCHTDD